MKAEAFIHITGALPAVNDHMMPTEVLISVWSFGNVLFYYCDYAQMRLKAGVRILMILKKKMVMRYRNPLFMCIMYKKEGLTKLTEQANKQSPIYS